MAVVKSSSIHHLNADRGQSKWGRRFWYSINWLNNSLLPNWKEQRLTIKKFIPQLSAGAWKRIHPKSSPSRALSDLFWMQLPWARMQEEMGEIHIVDTGCGSGRYGIELQHDSGGHIASYAGLDELPHADWPDVMKEYPFIKLQQADSAQFASFIPADTNLFISQSAIEHFPEDLTYFRQLRDFNAEHPRPIVQIHLFPSAACLRLYRFHGVRQYTPRTVSAITRLFPDSLCTLFELGGAACNALHWNYITKPILFEGGRDRRDTETAAYIKELHSAMDADAHNKGGPSFYAFIIQSHLRNSITETIAA
jgi:hypothetical protein